MCTSSQIVSSAFDVYRKAVWLTLILHRDMSPLHNTVSSVPDVLISCSSGQRLAASISHPGRREHRPHLHVGAQPSFTLSLIKLFCGRSLIQPTLFFFIGLKKFFVTVDIFMSVNKNKKTIIQTCVVVWLISESDMGNTV